MTPSIQFCFVCSHGADFWISGRYRAQLRSWVNVRQTFETLGVPDLFFCWVSFPQQTPKVLACSFSPSPPPPSLICMKLICELIFTAKNGRLWIKGHSVHYYTVWEAVVLFQWNFYRAYWVSRWYFYNILGIFYSYFHFSTVSVSSCRAQKSVMDQMHPFVKD